jgi:phosphoserine phosphatase RsbU/P
MDTKVFERFRESLQEQRQNIEDWLEQAPLEEKQVRLGPSNENAVKEHLEVLNTAVAKAEEKTLGLCTVCDDYVEMSRLEVDYTASICIDHFTPDQRRKLESELELSQKVQKALLPQQVPEMPGLEVAAFSQPARIVGGDYFDFFRFKDQSPGLVIADVMGKGVAASLLMASLQASLRILVTEAECPGDVAKRLNHLFCHNINLTKFVTLFLTRYEPDSRTLNYCNAGHNPPLLFRKNSPAAESVTWLQPTGAAIGLVEDFQFEASNVTLSPGDLLLLYTDGVTEARNTSGEEFETDRLADIVKSNSDSSARELVAALRRALQEFTNGQALEDDTTIVAVRVEN